MDWNEILQPALQAMAVALAGVLTAWAARLFQKAGVELSEAQQRQLNDAAATAVLAISERAARHAKAGLPKIDGPVLQEEAVQIVRSLAPKATDYDANAAVEAALPIMRRNEAEAGKAQPPRP